MPILCAKVLFKCQFVRNGTVKSHVDLLVLDTSAFLVCESPL